MSSKVSLAIWGCCFSRDSLSLGGGDEGFDVRFFAQSCSFPVQFTKHIVKDISLDDVEARNKFFKKIACYDVNKSVPQKILDANPEWLIIDFRTASYGIYRLDLGSGDHEYLTGPDIKSKTNALSKKGISFVPKKVGNDDKEI